MSAKSILSLLVIVSIAFSACHTPMVGYVTSTHNVPLLTEKNEGRISGAIGLNHSELQLSYSPVKHLGLMSNFYLGTPGVSGEYGLGYYNKIGNHFLIETYALYNKTSLSRRSQDHIFFISEHTDMYIQDLQAKYKGFAYQLEFAYLSDLTFLRSFAVGAKFARAFYSNYKLEKWHYSDWELQSQRLESHTFQYLPQSNLNFVDLTATYRIGAENVILMMQASSHINLDNLGDNPKKYPPYYSKAWFTVALELYINRELFNPVYRTTDLPQ